MKPSFALNLNDDSIGLLQRAPNGWLSIGSVQFDHPDLASALMELRDSIAGLGTQNLAAKLVIPNSQILYATLSAPGPNAALRRAQIAAALEGRTPYRVDELVFDWSGTGDEVQVAAVARETLTEAENFALEHGFKAVSFIAIPPEGSFAAEPWFGQTASASDFLAEGEKVVRDQDPIRITPSKGFALAPQVAETPSPRAVDAAPVPPVPEAAPAPLPVPEPEPEPVLVPAPSLDAAPAEAAPLPPEPAEPEPAAKLVDTPPVPDEAEPVATDLVEPTPVAVAPVAEPAPTPAEPTSATERPIAPAASRSPAAVGAAPAVAAAKPQEPVGQEQVAAKLAASLAKQVRPDEEQAPAPVAAAATATADDAALTLSWPGEDDSHQMASTKAALAASLAPVQSTAEAALVAGIRSDLKPLPAKAAPSAPARPAKAPAPAGSTISDKMQKAIGKATNTAKSKVKPAIARVTPSATSVTPPAKAAAQTLPAPSTEAEAMTVFGRRADKVGGKPRYLGLALVGALLAVLLGIAIWAATVLEPPRDAQNTAPTETNALAATEQAEAPAAQVADAPAAAPETAAPPSTAAAEQPATTTALAAAGEVDELTLPTPDAAVGTAPQAQIAATSAANGDVAPGPASALPEFGALFKFDAQGNILPSAEGVMTPDGVMLVAGRPRVIPPQRPDSVTAAATPPASATALPEPPANSAAVPLTPGAIALSPQVTPTPQATADAVAADVAVGPFKPDTTYAAYRPRQRPADIAPAATTPDPAAPATGAPAEEGALPQGTDETIDFVSRRPPARPARVTQTAAAAEAERNRQLAEASAAAAAAASTVATANAQEAAQLANIPGRRPAARPGNLEAAPAVQTAAVVAPSAAARATTQPELEEDEPPVTTRAAPSIPTRASVARQATVNRGINLGRINLLGVFGTANSRHALVRESGGRLVKVRVGDRLDGGQVVAISQSELRYQKRGQTVSLSMPRG